MEKVLVIGGPTAVGKTKLGIELAKKFDGEIISGDSMQVYKGLDIGTAKVKSEEMQGIKHHLIDIKEMDESYSAYDFQREARKLIKDIISRGKLPIVVGGTGLYIQSLLYDFELGAVANNFETRNYYEKYLREHGSQALWELLFTKDKQAAQKIHPNNPRRIVRALEVLESGGHIYQEEKPKLVYDAKIIALNTKRSELYERINKRVDLMLEEGLIDEAKIVYDKGEIQGSKAIGYKEFFAYFRGEETLEEAVEILKRNSRRYAKRQITWFKNRLDAVWYDLLTNDEYDSLVSEVKEWLND